MPSIVLVTLYTVRTQIHRREINKCSRDAEAAEVNDGDCMCFFVLVNYLHLCVVVRRCVPVCQRWSLRLLNCVLCKFSPMASLFRWWLEHTHTHKKQHCSVFGARGITQFRVAVGSGNGFHCAIFRARAFKRACVVRFVRLCRSY